MNFWDKVLKFFGYVQERSVRTPIEVPNPPISKVEDNSDYRKMFDSMSIKSEWRTRINLACEKILKGRTRYEYIQKETGVPWYMVGCIHLLESGCDFSTHLHNGDSLKKRTVHVPAGRPRNGNPPFTWEESAEDALEYDGIAKGTLTTIGEHFQSLEKFNGMGYRKKGINTPYLWSGSDLYSKGKFVADGKYDPYAVSKQVGAACIYKVLVERAIIKF